MQGWRAPAALEVAATSKNKLKTRKVCPPTCSVLAAVRTLGWFGTNPRGNHTYEAVESRGRISRALWLALRRPPSLHAGEAGPVHAEVARPYSNAPQHPLSSLPSPLLFRKQQACRLALSHPPAAHAEPFEAQSLQLGTTCHSRSFEARLQICPWIRR